MTQSPDTSLRFFDRCDDSHGYYFDATELVHHEVSKWQDIKIIDTALHGRIMLLDDVSMLTESTHHVYHEHMVHIPMACIEAPKSVLVIGGGDGGTISELIKYPGLETIVLAELDERVVEVSKDHLPELTKCFDDLRVELFIGDGAAYLASKPGHFDCVIVDSTDICEEAHDHDDIASPLASDQFQTDLKAALKPGGVAIQMLGSPTFYRRGMTKLFQRLPSLWPAFRPMLMPCPFYISGDWCGGLLSRDGSLTPRFQHEINGQLKYFNMDIASAALALPNEVREMLPHSYFGYATTRP